MDTRTLKANELRHFDTTEKPDWHRLPASHGYWTKRFLSPKVSAAFGTASMPHFFAKGFTLHRSPEQPLYLLSIGSGLCMREEETVRLLVQKGYRNVHMDCLEMSPDRVAAVRRRFDENGIANHISISEQDINEWTPRRKYTGVMANQSLHHFIELEKIFKSCDECLESDGRLLVNDIIGRNGHRRWPEVLQLINYLWSIMPRKFKYNHPFDRFDDDYVDWDYSKRSFEGIRAQDILPTLNQLFRATHLVAEGGIIDIFIERKYGHNFDLQDPEDARWLDEIGFMNDALIDVGTIKPTMLLAWFEKKSLPQAEEPVQYRHWSQEFCTRSCD